MKNIFPYTLDDQGPIAYFKIAAGLPVWAGFSTRIGGWSTGPFQGANMAFQVGDRQEVVAANRHMLAKAITAGQMLDFCTVSQIHGNRCLAITDSLPDKREEADALLTAKPGILLGVLTADCLPVIVVDCLGRVVAVAHAGWRGILAGVVPATIKAMQAAYGTEMVDLRVYCGPCIGKCCYRVGFEVIEEFASCQPFCQDDSWYELLTDGYHLDLQRLQLLQLLELGLSMDVSPLSYCTACSNFFFSYRREHGITGRQIAYVGLAS